MFTISPISFATIEKIQFADLFSGRLERFGIQEYIEEGRTSDNSRCLADRDNRVWVKALSDGTVDKYHTSEKMNYAGIFGAISQAFSVPIFSEHRHQFWGFSSNEKFEECWERRAADTLAYNTSLFQSERSPRDQSDADDLAFLDC
jgi:hypothetical protein